ncbi:MAG TPA: hypothetical protein PLC38_04090 [Methanobacterium sp.]|nr:MAG: hypothetical protein FGO69_11205 [Methanobacterium sp.]HOI71448.1 hypothetical protein [Methanobacterium sp.]
MNLDDKGQGSVEVLFVIIIVFMITVIFVGVITSASDKAETGSLAEARMQGEKIATAINNVYSHGSGYSINITIPPSPNMTAQVNQPENYITVISGGQQIEIKVIPTDINATNITSDPSGVNNIIYTVYNQNGTVYIKKN